MTRQDRFSRRLFLADLGRGTVALAVVGIAGCGPARSTGTAAGSNASPAASVAASAVPSAGSAAPSLPPPAGSSTASGGGTTWERVDLGFVSAYVLARGGEAAIVDTGTAGSEDDIAAGLEGIGLGWDAVGHVILTHLHGDHVGSLGAVLDAAADATGYAGAEDLPGISAPRPLVAVADGDDVFGLTIVATPGHTPGSISVLDEAGGILVAGDALGTSDGAVQGSNPQFTADMDAAMASVAKLGALRFETLLVGHGDPILSGASELVAAAAAG
jgi:glyoxylase-like metal-dependent hydrolase (beta-lactamase superfamily II)